MAGSFRSSESGRKTSETGGSGAFTLPSASEVTAAGLDPLLEGVEVDEDPPADPHDHLLEAVLPGAEDQPAQAAFGERREILRDLCDSPELLGSRHGPLLLLSFIVGNAVNVALHGAG